MSNIIERWQFRYSVVVEPATEPVTLDEAKLFARVDEDVDDALVDALIASARQCVEEETGIALMPQTRDAFLNVAPESKEFELSWRPIQSVTYIKALNEDGTDTEIDSTDILLDGANARIGIKTGADIFPLAIGDQRFNGFVIRYVSGYADAATVPEWAKTAIKMLVAHWYEHREASAAEIQTKIPFHIQMVLDKHKVVTI